MDTRRLSTTFGYSLPVYAPPAQHRCTQRCCLMPSHTVVVAVAGAEPHLSSGLRVRIWPADTAFQPNMRTRRFGHTNCRALDHTLYIIVTVTDTVH